MSDLESAACIIASVGCFADPAVANDGEFEIIDRNNRVNAAADELVDWVRDLLDGPSTRKWSRAEMVANLVASAMATQRSYDE
jgi:hypothetical protein